MLILAKSLFTKSKVSVAVDLGKYTLDAALHFCPWNSKAPRTIAVATCAGLAVLCAKIKSLPPVSPTILGYVL